MANNVHRLFNVADRSYFAIIKRTFIRCRLMPALLHKKAGEIDIIVAELVSNPGKARRRRQVMVKLGEEDGKTFHGTDMRRFW